MKRKKILMIAPDLGYGGAEKSFSRWADLFSEEHDVTLVVFNTASENVYVPSHKLISLNVPAGRNLISKIWFFVQRVTRLRKIKKQFSPDVAISFLEGADYVNVLSKQSEKVVLSIRGSKQYDSNISGLIGWFRHKVLMPYLYNRADLITVVSKGIEIELREFYQVKNTVPIQVIYNFYDTLNLKKSGSEPLSEGWENLLNNNEIMICVGRLARQKNYPFIIRVFAKLKKLRPQLKLVILGGGQLEPLITLSHKLGLSTFSTGDKFTTDRDIYFAGMVKNPHAYVSRASLFVLPSLFEGFPNSLAEAMAVETVSAAANCPYGPAEIFDQAIQEIQEPKFLDFGLLLPTSEERENDQLESLWATALIEALKNDSWRARVMQNAAARLTEFNVQKFRSSWSEMLN
ncbi:MAG TPA: glycosyltransferase [Cyclobacteriaceae bacterium]|nr:glycosyltransferase [Cyclobacteriaceae bacterium]HMV11007.1 glycosyltransferase [Cyclobacteriaceae bacterium]HMV88606.1 glycosyltransferase [Cyclobacteriaceae bacterium]HMX00632.1 glycosyltransferase [Cyclobacteriaceae bacterium]HMX49493.1 glycosyltransferase [Cyclobacteriaceae bacterium]